MQRVEAELREMTRLDTLTIYNIFRRLHTDYRFQTPTAVRERQAKKLRNRIRFERIYEHIIQGEVLSIEEGTLSMSFA